MSDIYLQITETPTVVTLSAPVVSGALASTVTVANTVTVALDSNSLSALENVTVTVGAAITGTVTVSNFPASQAVTFSAVSISNFPATQPVSIASVTIGNTVTIAGTVTANPTGTQTIAGTVTANGLAVGSTVANVFPIGVDTQFSGVRTVTDLIGYRLPISLGDSGTVVSASLSDPLPAGTNRIGVVTIGGGTVTIGAGTAQIGSVTASLAYSQTATTIASTAVTAIPVVFPTSGAWGGSLQGYNGSNTYIYSGIQAIGSISLASATSLPVSLTTLPALAAGTAQIGSVTVANSVTIGSLPAISGTVTANLVISSTAITSGRFTSLTSATLVPANTARKMATIYNLGAGQLFVNAGVTATTLGGGFMVALSSGDFYECNYTTTTLSAIFATAGTASWVSH